VSFGTFTIDTSSQPGDAFVVRRHHDRPTDDQFAAVVSSLGGTRSAFYGNTGRLPNARQDDTRKQRTLVGGSGNRHLGALDLWTEREISRYLVDNSEIFEGIIGTWACEVLQTGFRLKSLADSEDLKQSVKEALFGHDDDDGWFAECDSRRMLHFWELLTLAEETELTDGDHAFALHPEGNGGRGSVSIVEADRILTPSGYTAPEGRVMFNGVECDIRTGRPLRFFVCDEAPETCHATTEDGRLYPAFAPDKPADGGILFSVRPKRYSATRRQPYLSTAVRGHDEISDALVATRIAVRNQACRSTYTKIADWEAYLSWMQTVDPLANGVAPVDPLTHSPNPGDHTYLNPGEDAAVLDSTQPGNNFDALVKMNLRFIGLPLGMGLEEVVKLFDRNFSASRLSLQGTRRRYARRQRAIKRHKVNPIKKFAIARLQEVGDLPRENQTVFRFACTYPAWDYIEPLKDAKADRELRDMKIKSSQTISEERGYDYEKESAEIDTEGPLTTATTSQPPENDK
jgi:capsid protein